MPPAILHRVIRLNGSGVGLCSFWAGPSPESATCGTDVSCLKAGHDPGPDLQEHGWAIAMTNPTTASDTFRSIVRRQNVGRKALHHGSAKRHPSFLSRRPHTVVIDTNDYVRPHSPSTGGGRSFSLRISEAQNVRAAVEHPPRFGRAAETNGFQYASAAGVGCRRSRIVSDLCFAATMDLRCRRKIGCSIAGG